MRHLQVTVHEAGDVQELHGIDNLLEDGQALSAAAIGGICPAVEPLLEAVLTAQLHLDVEEEPGYRPRLRARVHVRPRRHRHRVRFAQQQRRGPVGLGGRGACAGARGFDRRSRRFVGVC